MIPARGVRDAAVLAVLAWLVALSAAAQTSTASERGAPDSGAAADRPPKGASAAQPAPSPATPPTQDRRRSMLPLVQPLWSELSEAQQQVLQPFASQWNSWPSVEKENWRVLADRVPQMKPEERARTEERIREWAALTPEQRRVARLNYRLARKLPPDERKAQWERYTQLTPEQRAVLRTSGWTSNTAARHAGAPTGLAKDAAQPFAPRPVRTRNPK